MTMCGNVTKDAEKRVINNKECLCFTVATDAGYGENKQTTFWNVVWTTKYDSIAKGTRIYVDGIPRFKTFEKKDGLKVEPVMKTIDNSWAKRNLREGEQIDIGFEEGRDVRGPFNASPLANHRR